MNTPESLQLFEVRFQKLRFQLSLKLSPRLKTRLLGSFCHALLQRPNPVLNLSYYEELVTHLIELSTPETLSYQPLDIISAFYETLTILADDHLFAHHSKALDKARQTARLKLVACLLCLGEYPRAIQIERREYPCSLQEQRFENVTDLNALLSELRSQAAATGIIHDMELLQFDGGDRFSGWSNQKVWVPLIEKFNDGEGTEVVVGTLHPLNLFLERRQNKQQQDQISFNNHPISHDDLVNYQAQDAIRAARRQHSLLRKRQGQHYTVSFGFPSTEHVYTGSSFGLGMALLSLCALEEDANLRKQHSLGNHIAFTGGVDFEGTVRKVDRQGLEEKIRTAFFSPLTTIVIPKENLPEAESILNKLSQEYPNKVFHLKCANNLHEALNNRELVTYKKMPLKKWMKNHITRSTLLRGGLAFLLLVLTIWMAVLVITDKNPSDYRVEGESVLLLNRNGRFLWKVDLGHVPKNLEKPLPPKQIYSPLQIHDFDGDGENEVILGTAVKQHEFNGKLMLLETDGSLRWEYSEHPTLTFGSNEYTNNYGTAFILPYQHLGDKTHEFYVRFSHMPWFPNRLVRFDINGNVLNEFIHPGSIEDMELIDLDHDGELEILLGGTNNGFNSAFLAILPSRNFHGTVPESDDDHSLINGVVDSNLIYIKFPRWGKYDFSGTNARTHAADVFPDSDQSFSVIVMLGSSVGFQTFIYHFSYDLKILELSVADGLLAAFSQKTGKKYFEVFDQAEWYQDMTQLEIFQHGAWSPLLPPAKK